MTRPLSVARRRPRHGRRRRAEAAARQRRRSSPRAPAGRSRSTAVSARDRTRDRGVSLGRPALVRGPGGARRRSGGRRRGRADRRRGRAGARAGARRRWPPASRWSPPTRRCSRCTAPRSPRWPKQRGVPLAFEAAVAGGIPVIKALREGLAANRISRIAGILNGTCNYILTHDARARPRVRRGARRGAEARLRRGRSVASTSTASTPRTSWRSWPALAFGRAGRLRRRACRGHPPRLRARHRASPSELGYRIKLLGIARQTDGGIEQRVHPCMVPRSRADRACRRRVQRRGGRGRLRRPRHAGGPRRRRRADRLGGGRRPDRHRARPRARRCSGCRPAALSERAVGADERACRRLLPAADGGRPAGRDRRRHRGAARPAASRWKSMLQRGRAPGEAVPVVLTTHETRGERDARAR